MTLELTVRAGTSTALQFRLLAGTAPLNLAAVGTVELWLKDREGGTTMTNSVTGKLSINGAAGGSVSWTPGSADLVSGSAPYRGYFKAWTSGSAFYFIPDAYDLTVNVREIF